MSQCYILQAFCALLLLLTGLCSIVLLVVMLMVWPLLFVSISKSTC